MTKGKNLVTAWMIVLFVGLGAFGILDFIIVLSVWHIIIFLFVMVSWAGIMYLNGIGR